MSDYIDWHRVIVPDTWTVTGDPRYDRLVAPDGWRIASLSKYCGSSECFVAEFVDADGNCVTYYGSVPTIQRQMDALVATRSSD